MKVEASKPETEKMHKAQLNLGKHMLDRMLIEIHALPNVWQKCSEAQQGEVIDRLCAAIDSAVANAIVILAAGDLAVISAEVESVTFKDGVKAVFAVQKDSPFRHDLADAQGATIQILLTDVRDYTQSARDVKPTPDQPDLKIVETAKAIEHTPGDE